MENKQKNFLPIAGIGIILVIVVVVFIFNKQKPTSTNKDSVLTQSAKNCSYDEDFCKYSASMANAISQGYVVTNEYMAEGKVYRTEMKMDGKGNSDIATYVGSDEQSRTIMLDKFIYTKTQGSNEWLEFAGNNNDTDKTGSNFLSLMNSVKENLEQLSDENIPNIKVTKVGTEKCGSLNCIVYEINDSISNSKTRVAFDTKDYLARRMEYSGQGAKNVMTYDYKPVNITKPSPIKKMPSAEDMMKDSGVNMQDVQKMMEEAQKNIPDSGANIPDIEE